MIVYLDNSATTKIRDEVMKEIADANENLYGNPSSLHRMGLSAEKKINEARKFAARLIGAKPQEIYFTGGGTESNNIAIFGHLSNLNKQNNIITTKIEHPSVYNVFKQFEDKCQVKYLGTDEKGRINIQELGDMVDENTLLISIMHVNNEIGAVQELEEIAAVIKRKNKNARLHVDAVQSYGKIKIDVNKLSLDTLSFSSHKIHGPKGVGGLYIRSPLKLGPLVFGGGQERGIRPGTENTTGIMGFGKACELLYDSFKEETIKLYSLKKIYVERLKEIEDIKINSPEEGAPHIISVSFKNVPGEVLVHYLEDRYIYVSTGSACSSKSRDNRILDAINLGREYREGTIRISLGHFNSLEEVEYVIDSIKQSVKDIRSITRRG
ncbi:MAG TPA: cysteine desulfurase family protein [Sedimentibacter sp.]|mgnify:CR=1 FL=1|nr:cysteine desulfurase [Sedimentibacter sp.]HNZ82159.1 cysteine desulfurase family protein [Sedimentibacter sp.]HOH68927.1 cysteine desulfurase family protein [Sedimentibacter sp.]HPW99673.1 cysteine desulfurase family protein [Sedimentibacter sp.]HQB63391.1 cysteine desulfurase family protein [Sedimentibacter sp.]